MANQTQTAATTAKDTSSTPVPVQHENGHVYDWLNGEIARKAYELYEQAGNEHGQDLSHWLQAEAQIVQRIPEIHESSSWYTVHVPLPGFSAEEVHVGVEPSRAIIAANRTSSTDDNASSDNGSSTGATRAFHESIFLIAEWPEEVDPATASAYIRDESLTLTVKRATQTRIF